MLLSLRNTTTSWWRNTPLPARSETQPKFQKWHHYHDGRWTAVTEGKESYRNSHAWEGTLQLVTWNIDADAPKPGSRMTSLLRTIEATAASANVLFFQEVTQEALAAMLADSWIRSNWTASDVDISSYGTQKSITIALVSKACLTSYNQTTPMTLSAIWRIPLPSYFYRDALCFDLLMNQHSGRAPTRLRLANVHLDSLAINPSRRPQQLAIVASYLEAVNGGGLVAGDFNPVLPEDEHVVCKNGLVDAWTHLYPAEEGFTWGCTEGKNHSFPPNRLDKVAVRNLSPLSMRVLRADVGVGGDDEGAVASGVPLSDHHGLFCQVGWKEGQRDGAGT